jgi:hypothetical protein
MSQSLVSHLVHPAELAMLNYTLTSSTSDKAIAQGHVTALFTLMDHADAVPGGHEVHGIKWIADTEKFIKLPTAEDSAVLQLAKHIAEHVFEFHDADGVRIGTGLAKLALLLSLRRLSNAPRVYLSSGGVPRDIITSCITSVLPQPLTSAS